MNNFGKNFSMVSLSNIKIAVDFDGTIVDHEYPAIGKEKLFAFQTLKELEKRGPYLFCGHSGLGRSWRRQLSFVGSME
jgi:hypothetical protein